MNTSNPSAKIISLVVTDHYLTVRLSDGRVVSNPLEWYPRLFKASSENRAAFEISGDGYGVHWEKLDEDLSAKGIAAGIPAGDYQALTPV